MLEGPPACISASRVASICRRFLGDAALEISHQRISSFRDTKLDSPVIAEFRETLKERGTFRILASSATGARCTLICKNDPRPRGMTPFQQWWFFGNYRPDPEPPTEALIYQEAEGALAELVPGVYGTDELEPGRHYQYLLEDLVDWEQVRSSTTVLNIVAALPGLHAALRTWSLKVGAERLSRGDAMHRTHTDDIDRYARESGDPLVATIRDVWHLLLELAETHEYQRLQDLTTIHGDLWVDNVLVDPADSARTRIIDWESVVRGRPHFDLALLLMRERSETVEQALSIYASANKTLSLSEHWRLYRWCRLEYCVLKAINLTRSFVLGETPELALSYHAGQAISQARFYSQLFARRTLDRADAR